MILIAKLFNNRRWQSFVSLCRLTRINLVIRDVKLGKKIQLGRNVFMETRRALPGFSQIEIGNESYLDDFVRLEAWGGAIRLGKHVFLGSGTIIYGHGNVLIGDECLISMHCKILSSNHTVPVMGTDIRSQPDVLLPTKIGRDVWLGAGVTVLGGVTIGDGCVVGAGAVVTKDLPAGAIAYGVPAEISGWRPEVTERKDT